MRTDARRPVGLLRLIAAGLGAAAIIGQLVIGAGRPTFRVGNFFSFFTIESNVLALVVFAVAGMLGLAGRDTGPLSAWRGAATLFMTITGVVYVLLLSGLEESLQTATPWVNTILHYIVPVLALLDWLLDRSVRRLTFRTAAWWLLFPAAYLVYTLVRGPVVDWYPYPFTDPRPHGYLPVIAISVGIALFAAALSWLLAWTTRLGRRSGDRAAAAVRD